MELSTIIGTVGVSLLLLAFLLNLFRIIKEDSLSYILLNIGGAAIACIASVMIEFVPFIVLEVIWTLVGIVGLIKYIGKRSKTHI
jgi:predicted membrane protein